MILSMSSLFTFLLVLSCFFKLFISKKVTSKPESVEFVLSCMNDSSLHFLEYLPHSGFSNQVNELGNALLLASLLNRTLILPPFFIGDYGQFAWRNFDTHKRNILDIYDKYDSNSPDNSWILFDALSFFPGLRNLVSVRQISYKAFKNLKKSVNFDQYILKDYSRYNYR